MESFLQFRYIKIVLLFVIFLFFSNILSAKPLFKKLSDLDGLKIKYNFSFWLTSNAAYATLRVENKAENKYKITLTGETKGMVGFFASYRKDVMVSDAIYDRNLKRFIPLKFDKKIIVGKNLKHSEYTFDYENKKIVKKKTKIIYEDIEDSDDPFAQRKIVKHSSYTIPMKKYPVDDYLTASLNFFIGVYGFPEKNKTITIYLFPESSKKKRNRLIKVTFLEKKESLFKIFIDLNVDFISDNIKKAYGFINKNMIPEKIEIPTGTVLGTIHVERVKTENDKK